MYCKRPEFRRSAKAETTAEAKALQRSTRSDLRRNLLVEVVFGKFFWSYFLEVLAGFLESFQRKGLGP